ncbi:p300 4L [African swine fever virus]|uniref:p300 4L n=1 Tax=African swine fever virus TaxID=10497 RepID=A0A894KR58_ASF|nr:p300 4L [African swine fever virus]
MHIKILGFFTILYRYKFFFVLHHHVWVYVIPGIVYLYISYIRTQRHVHISFILVCFLLHLQGCRTSECVSANKRPHFSMGRSPFHSVPQHPLLYFFIRFIQKAFHPFHVLIQTGTYKEHYGYCTLIIQCTNVCFTYFFQRVFHTMFYRHTNTKPIPTFSIQGFAVHIYTSKIYFKLYILIIQKLETVIYVTTFSTNLKNSIYFTVAVEMFICYLFIVFTGQFFFREQWFAIWQRSSTVLCELFIRSPTQKPICQHVLITFYRIYMQILYIVTCTMLLSVWTYVAAFCTLMYAIILLTTYPQTGYYFFVTFYKLDMFLYCYCFVRNVIYTLHFITMRCF